MLKGYASSYSVEILNSFDTGLQLKNNESANKNKLKKNLTKLRGFKFATTLVLELKKIESEDKTKYDTFYSHSKAETIINGSEIDDNVFKSIYTKVISNIQQLLGNCSGWIIDSVIEHNTNMSKYNPLAGGSYIKLPKEFNHPRKGLINIQNTDHNE